MKKPAVKITVTILAAIAVILLAFHITAVAVISSEYDGDGGGFSAFFWAESELGKLKLSEVIVKIKYKFTGKLSYNGVEKGGDYLFPTKSGDFDYKADAEGRLSFSEEECKAILANLTDRQSAYMLDGAEYYVFVIPNSQSVLKDELPFGEPSAQSRAEKLEEYLKENGFENFRILDTALRDAEHETYHNTENSINEYGAYAAFKSIIPYLPEQLTRRMNDINIGENDIKTYYSNGRSLAEKVKLQRVIKNKNVFYDTTVFEAMFDKELISGLTVCRLKDEYNDFLGSSCLLVESYDKTELDMIKPLFAAAFSDTCFKDNLSYSKKAAQTVSPAAVVCLIREDRLNALLEEYDAETYRNKLNGDNEEGVTDAPTDITVVPMTPHTALIAGNCETSCDIFIEDVDEIYEVKGVCGRFLAEISADNNEKIVRITSKASNKALSEPVNVTVRTVFGASCDADIGNMSMLYYLPTVRDYAGTNLFSEKRMANIKSGFETYIAHIRNLTGKKTKVIFLVAPDPLSIYPDAASEKHLSRRADYTRLDQASEALADVEGLVFLDLREQMKMNSDIGKLFYQTDTHWTELGAYFGYRAVISAISEDYPAVSPASLTAFDINEKTVAAGDLASFTGLVGFTENVQFLTPTSAYKAVGVPEKPETIDRSVYAGEFTSRTGNAAYPTALVIRDSYSANLFPMLCEHFNTLYCQPMWNADTDEAKLAELRADYVIIVCSERNLDTYVR